MEDQNFGDISINLQFLGTMLLLLLICRSLYVLLLHVSIVFAQGPNVILDVCGSV